MAAAQQAMHGAMTHAKEAAEQQRRPDNDKRPREYTDKDLRYHQAVEIETSNLRNWARRFDGIEECRRS
jgi:hypothetical protein